MIGIDSIGIGSDLCKNWNDDVIVWMRNGKWTKKLDYGESKTRDTVWPKQPKWFQKGSDIVNVYKGLIKSGMSQKNANKIIGLNWLDFIRNSFG